jgi:hypothetical protein
MPGTWRRENQPVGGALTCRPQRSHAMRFQLVIGLTLASGLFSATPSAALDVGGSIGAGGVGADAGVGASSGGVGAGAGVSAGGLGGVGAGAAADGGGASVGAGAGLGAPGVGASGNAGVQSSGPGSGAQGGVAISGEAGVGRAPDAGGSRPISGGVGPSQGAATSVSGTGSVGSMGESPSAGRASGRGGAPAGNAKSGVAASQVQTPLAPRAVAAPGDRTVQLPLRLAPLDGGSADRELRRTRSPLTTGSLRPLASVPGTPPRLVTACRNALSEAAASFGAVRVDVASTAQPRSSGDGGISAPMQARIVYARSGRMQVRQARVTCQFDPDGQVIAAL